MTRWTFALAVAWLWVPLPQTAAQDDAGATREQIGEYTLVYSAVRSDAVPEAVARRHGLPADSESVLLNVTVQHRGENIPASIDARAVNLAEQVRAIEMHETVANDLVSYLGVVEIADREVLDFQLEILPQGADQAITLEFREEFVPIPEARDAIVNPR